MAKTDIKGRLNGRGVIFAVESGHLIMFHDQKAWDSDAANFYGCSKRSKYFSTDLGVCSAAPDRNEIETLLARWNFVPGYVLEIEGETTPEAAPATAAPDATAAALATAFQPVFAGVEANILKKVEAKIQPIIDRAPVVHEHVIKTPDKVTKITGAVHSELDNIIKFVNAGLSVYMYGPAGSGKNVIAKQVADALGLQFYFANSITQEHKITGYSDAAGVFHETEFFRAFTRGGLFFMDELDASIPEVLILLNAALANKYLVFGDGKRYEAHKDFRVIAAGNTNGTGATQEYNGRYQLDAATLNRFLKVYIDYCPEVENAISNGDEEILIFIRQLRKIAKERRITVILSYREIIHLTLLKGLISIEDAIKDTISNAIDEDTRHILFSALPSYDNKYIRAAKKAA